RVTGDPCPDDRARDESHGQHAEGSCRDELGRDAEACPPVADGPDVEDRGWSVAPGAGAAGTFGTIEVGPEFGRALVGAAESLALADEMSGLDEGASIEVCLGRRQQFIGAALTFGQGRPCTIDV